MSLAFCVLDLSGKSQQAWTALEELLDGSARDALKDHLQKSPTGLQEPILVGSIPSCALENQMTPTTNLENTSLASIGGTGNNLRDLHASTGIYIFHCLHHDHLVVSMLVISPNLGTSTCKPIKKAANITPP